MLEAEAKKRVHVSDADHTRKELGGRRQLSMIMEEIPDGNIAWKEKDEDLEGKIQIFV